MNLSITTFIKLALSLLLVLLSSNTLAQLQPDQPTDAPPVFSKSVSEVINGPFETTIEFSQTEDQFTVVEIGGYGVNTYETLGDIELKETQWSPQELANYPRKFYLVEEDSCINCTLNVHAIENDTTDTIIEIKINTYNKAINKDRFLSERILKNLSKIKNSKDKIEPIKKLIALTQNLGEIVKSEELKQSYIFAKSETHTLQDDEISSLLSLSVPQSQVDYLYILSNAYYIIGFIQLQNANYELAELNLRKSINLINNREIVSHKEEHLRNWTLAYYYNNLANTISKNPTNIDRANILHDTAYEYAEKSHNNIVKELVLNNKGWSARAQNKLSEASHYHSLVFDTLISPEYQSSITKHALNEKLMRTQYHMAIVSAIRGRYYNSLNLLKRAEEISLRDSHKVWIAHIKAAKGKIFMELNQFKKSQDEYNTAWRIYEELGDENELGVISINLGKLYSKLGNHELALKYLNDSYEIFSRDKDNEYKITVLSTEAESYLSSKNYDNAISILTQLLHHTNESDNAFLEGRTLTNLAEAQIGIGKHSDAFITLKKAIKINKNNKDDLFFTRSNYLAALSLSKDQLKNYDEALLFLKTAKNTIENIRSTLFDDSIRQQYFSLQKSIYELEINLHMSNTNNPKSKLLGLLSAESYRARTLYESITHEKPKNSLESTPLNNTSEQEITESSILLKNTFDDLLNTKPTHRQNTINLEELESIIKNLDEKTAILYFFTGSEKSHSWLITKNKILSGHLPKSETIALTVANYMNSSSNSPSGQHPLNVWRKLHKNGIDLSHLILSDYEEPLKNYTKILIAPDGPLHKIPFSALPLEDSKELVIDNYNVSYLSSLATHHILNKYEKKIKAHSNLLLLSNPDIISNGIEGTDLPSAKLEAEKISKLWQSVGKLTWLDGENAHKKALVNSNLSNYDVLHFATHALANWDYPGQSFIALSNKKSPKKLDNNLTQLEISNWDISAELVVLSACDTALGKHIEGEGPLGLSRAFIEAGAKRVIASLWPIDDEASAELMKNFYHNLYKKNQTPIDALANAQRTLKTNGKWSHPYYWSGFNFVGNSQSWQ
ncbi:CHAT domain-containing protein [Sessilibacter corallicola]|uniref:CHAT domain-containing protein n=1 Tax=Sessilibacter corallicola TaxID=2904075 RepID=UPI001E313491|nr:CHAT domain-containing tetratricopeptide repeat protein [Sessilibacter corallicola]MCE2028312.1 CHAT domain-containing protein [Sessilibacter corallicola]